MADLVLDHLLYRFVSHRRNLVLLAEVVGDLPVSLAVHSLEDLGPFLAQRDVQSYQVSLAFPEERLHAWLSLSWLWRGCSLFVGANALFVFYLACVIRYLGGKRLVLGLDLIVVLFVSLFLGTLFLLWPWLRYALRFEVGQLVVLTQLLVIRIFLELAGFLLLYRASWLLGRGLEWRQLCCFLFRYLVCWLRLRLRLLLQGRAILRTLQVRRLYRLIVRSLL